MTAELRRARPPRSARGLVVFCTGLSGSGKSTLARDLRDALLERGDRTVSLLDGDLVRRLLSAGLTFSREDRDLNIARIGFVAAEVARHGGIAICAPIAPYAAARAAVRRMVSEVGRLRPRARVDAARGVRGARPQGTVRAGAGRDHRLVHRDLRPLRGAGRRRPGDRHVGHVAAGAVAAVLGYLTRGGWLALADGLFRFLVVLGAVLGRGALFEALAELGDLRSAFAPTGQPAVELVRDDWRCLFSRM